MPVILPTSFTKSDIPIGSIITISETRMRDNDEDQSIYEIGDRVTVKKNYRNRTPRTGSIDRKIWHHKHQLWNYFINDDFGKPVSKRYTAVDFSLPENAG